MEKVTFQFVGGLADNHELNFYEAGRFQYGAARFLYTLEKFRQTGRVISRLNQKVKADIRVKAATEGSFIVDALVVALPLLQDCAIKTSFEVLFTHAWSTLLPNSKAKEAAVEVAKQMAVIEHEKTEQEREKTKQIGAVTHLAELVVSQSNATAQQSMTLLQYALDNKLAIPHYTPEQIETHHQQAIEEAKREELLEQNKEALSEIPPEVERKLNGQLRKSIADIAKPLHSSATGLVISQSSSNQKVAHIDAATAKALAEQEEDPNITSLLGSIDAYDKSGYGKFSNPSMPKTLTFRVPSGAKKVLQEKIIEAMKKEFVMANFYIIRDADENPVSLILDNIQDEEDREGNIFD